MRTTRMLKLLCSLLLIPGSIAFGQDNTPAPPEETEILLPPEFFDLRRLGSEEVVALLPSLPPIESPMVEVPLPEPEGVETGATTIRIPEPEEVFEEEATPGGSSVFTTGTVGAGSVNYILGELALFKIGEDPRFRFEFLHRGLDGFAFNSPGTGYFRRVDRLSGWVAAESDGGAAVEGSATYGEREIGFQGRPSFYSAEFRRIEGALDVSYPLADRVSAYAAAQLGYVNRLYTVKDPTADPPRAGESGLRPRFGVEFDFNRLRLDLHGRYALRYLDAAESEDLQLLGGGVEVGYELGDSWRGRGAMEILHEFDRGFLFPFSLTLGYDHRDTLGVEFSGGLDYRIPSLRSLWLDRPFLASLPSDGGALPSQEASFGEAGVSWRPPFTGLELELSGRYEDRRRDIDIQGYDGTEDILPFEIARRERLSGRFLATWSPNARLELSAGWRREFLDRHFLEVADEGSLRGDYLTSGGVWGGRFDMAIPVYGELLLPIWNIEGYLRPLEAVEVRLGLDDVLSPLLEEGRGVGSNEPTTDYPFVQPGFTVRLETRITL